MFPSVVTATHTHTQDEMACNLHPIICTWDAVTTCTPVTIFFPTWGVVMLEYIKYLPPPPQKKNKNTHKVAPKAMWKTNTKCGGKSAISILAHTTYHDVR